MNHFGKPFKTGGARCPSNSIILRFSLIFIVFLLFFSFRTEFSTAFSIKQQSGRLIWCVCSLLALAAIVVVAVFVFVISVVVVVFLKLSNVYTTTTTNRFHINKNKL